MTDKDTIRERRSAAISARLSIGDDDRIVEMIPRSDGLHMVTLEKIIRVNLPNEIDPELEHADAPIVQTIVVEAGSRHPIVARTILQTRQFADLLGTSDQSSQFKDVAWEVMLSLLAFDKIVNAIDAGVNSTKHTIAENYVTFTMGASPPPPPMIDDLEIDFRSAALIGNHVLSAISDLFPVLFSQDFKRGRFDKLIGWSAKQFGTEAPLTRMLEGDHRWIRAWSEVRNALEHPKPNYYVRVNNFRLLANRQIQLPTWQLIHADLDLHRPQALIEPLKTYRDNLLGFFENLVVELSSKVIELPFRAGVVDIPEEDRDPDCPKRYAIAISNRDGA